MKRFFLLLSLTVLTACNSLYKDIRISSVGIESIEPCGLRDVNVNAGVTVYNPSKAFSITDAAATVFIDGTPCVNLHADGVDIEAESTKRYSIPVSGTLDRQFSLLTALGMLRNRDFKNCTVNAEFMLRRGGMKRKVRLKNVPLEKITGKI